MQASEKPAHNQTNAAQQASTGCQVAPGPLAYNRQSCGAQTTDHLLIIFSPMMDDHTRGTGGRACVSLSGLSPSLPGWLLRPEMHPWGRVGVVVGGGGVGLSWFALRQAFALLQAL